MYSLILMAAATGGGDVAGFGWKNGNGCTGTVVYSSCQGSCYGSYSYSGCSGCYGTYHPAGCFGFSTWNSWAGSSCSGCSGCTGCQGAPARGLFHRGSCRGSSCHGCSGLPVYGCSGCFGSTVSPPTVVMPAATPTPAAPTAANIQLELPAGATLFVEGQKVAGEGRTRNFHTPELPTDRQFFYDMRAEVTVAGKTTSEDLRVVVAGGQTVTKSFAVLIAAVEKAGGAKVASK